MKTADAWGGDAYPGEEPETEALAEQTAPRRDYSEQLQPDPPVYHNWVLINGHLVMDSDRSPEQLVDDHGYKDTERDLAYGRVAVTHRWSANFQVIHSNIGISLVLRELKKYAKQQGWGDVAIVDHNGEELAMDAKVAALDGVGEQNPDKAWSLTDKNPGTDIQNGEFYMNPAKDAPKSGLYECPHCGLELENYTDFRTHLMDEKSALTAPNDTPDLAPIDHDKVMPADWNNSSTPDWVGIMSKVGMADRSGIPEVDALIEEFLKMPQGDWTTDDSPYETLRNPELAHGSCQEVTWHFVEFAKSKGFEAYATDTDLDEMGYKPSIEPFGEIGFDENDKMQVGFYPEHTIATIVLPGTGYGREVYIDFTASQYGYTDHPKVTSHTKTAAELGRYQILDADGNVVNDSAPDAAHCIDWAKDMAITSETGGWNSFHAYDAETGTDLGSFKPDKEGGDPNAVYPGTWDTWHKEAAPKVTIPGPIPFIFDIEDDRIYVGHPGEEIGDVQAGDYNPLGIVEGLYKPTGEVEISTQTNMPYTIRHMIQLWYYMHPELEVKSVVMIWEDGGKQKLAKRKHSMALRPNDLDEWIKHNGPYMVHWTKPEYADSIMQQGIVPWERPLEDPDSDPDDPYGYVPDIEFGTEGPRANWDGYAETRPNHVYMATPDNTDLLGMQNSKGDAPFKHPIHVDLRQLDPTKFKADEDWARANWLKLRPSDVEEDDWRAEEPPYPADYFGDGSGSESLGQWADREGLDDPDWTQKSLKGYDDKYGGGSLAYEGAIPPEALRQFEGPRLRGYGLPQDYHDFMDEWRGYPGRDENGQPRALTSSTDVWYTEHVAVAPDNVGDQVRKLLEADPSAVGVYDALSPLGNVYVVGGAIRDLALGRIPKDIDIMAQGIEPDDAIKALKLLPGHVEVTGNQFPVIRYFHPSGAQCEVALPRREQSTGGGRKQDFDVQMDVNMPVEEDLERRDFTGNSMAVDLKTGQLIDPYGGWKHLEDGELKMVHSNAFVDDATRILRALSSRSRHGLRPDQETMDAMKQWASRIDTHVPNEQKAAELEKLLSGDDPASAIELAQKTGVLKHILPELDETVGFDQKSKYHDKLLFDHIMEVLRTVSEINKDPDVRMAALLHDIGKPGSQWFDDAGYGHYYRKHFKEDELDEHGLRKEPIGLDHEHHGADLARDRLKELTWGNKSRQDRVEHLVRHHMFAPFSDERGARKFLNKVEGIDHAKDLVDIRQGDAGSKALPWDGDEGKMRGLLDTVQQQGQATDLSGLALNGQDVMQILGIKPSKEVGEHLNRLQEIVLEDPSMNNRETLTEALTMKQARRMVFAKEFDGWCWALLPKEAPLADAPDADNAHVTLAMVKGMDGLNRATASSIAAAVEVPITAKITGCTAFPEGDDGTPVVLVISAPEIDRAREIVTERLDEVDADYSSDYGFIPHITLGYARDDDEVAKLTEEGDALIGDEIVFDASVYSGGDGVWKTPGHKRANILDPVQETLDPDVFDNADKAKPKVKPHIVEWIRVQVDGLLKANGWEHVISSTHLVMTGSLTSYQWSHKSDFDVSVWFDYPKFPNIVRAAMISLMVEELDGTIVPGTTHELQCYIVPDDVTPEELYQPGLRSAYDLDKNKWMVAPERDRVFNPYAEVPALMGWVHDQAEKLKLLKNYDEPLYKEFLHQIHTRRQRDQKAGKGDFSESNIVWKYIEHMGLT